MKLMWHSQVKFVIFDCYGKENCHNYIASYYKWWDLYEDETGYQKGEIQKRNIVETEIFSVDERIKIISGIIAIMGKEEGKGTRGR